MSLKMNPIQGYSSKELLSMLRQQDIKVPSRGKGRRTEHAEIYTACHLLSTLATTDHLRFPVQITHRDKPDFLLEFKSNEVGVEITEAISPQYAKFNAIANRKFPNALIEPAHFGRTSIDRSKKEMEELLRQKKLTSPGWQGDQPEREWAQYINERIANKLKTLVKCGFKKFDNNWLSIYDNLPYGGIDVEMAVEFLLPKITDVWSLKPAFDSIFIESGNTIVCITADGTEILPLNNLWEM